ncbi:MAG: MarR family transcriptional regulator [Candidatus Limnocylindrales bacterium]
MRTTCDPDTATNRHRAAEEALSSLGRAVGSLRCAGSQRLVRLGISMTHFHVLTLLRHHDAMPMGRLAEILDASMSSATGIIDRMEERGLVERVRVPDDRRVVLVRPTTAGLDLVDEAELVKSEVMANALARLTPDQLDRLTAATGELQLAIAEELATSPTHGLLGLCDHVRTPATHEGTGVGATPAAPIDRRVAHAAGAASPTPGPAGS